MSLKEEAYKEIENLVSRFEEQLQSYKKSDYNETLVRRDFIDPFFKALGWDVDNSQGYAEAYREVIHEDRIKISTATKAPDYSFRLPGGKRLFFVEAKKSSVYIKEEVLPAYQVRRYGWSAKLPVSIVTDFEEFALYDCIKKPALTDKASTARIKYFTYKEYLNQFDFLWDTFSKEKVLRGGLDKFAVSDKLKKGTATVDREFLNSLDEWRKELALNIALRNNVNNDELNFVVQALLDRLIFLRIAEDRNIETYGSLKDCTISIGGEKNIIYTRLLKLFTEADSKYNSGIFNFKQDRISKRLEIDNATLRRIIQQLYYPESPYEFSVINVEILGSAYEQFLGKQIFLKGTHKATIEEKPEVRKAGGVYYTPQYIVDYIVDNTVGKKLKEIEEQEATSPKPSPKERALEALKIIDPACGSGSFLLGAYDKLLKWHHAYYLPEFERLSAVAGSNNYVLKQRNDAVRERSKLPFTPEGRLTTTIKKQILLNNIYGVDIDANAVEVTKLSLLLKCLEDETQSSINAELRFTLIKKKCISRNTSCSFRCKNCIMKKISTLIICAFIVCELHAQLTTTPDGGNKKAMVAERIGITDITIDYSRPGVKGRDGKIWGELIAPGYNDLGFGNTKTAPWRAGANENTTIEFSTDVKIEGASLPAGKYALFIAYNPNECTIIFSKNYTSWGSFFYDEKEDALRVKVKPAASDKGVEWLKYEFINQAPNSATVALEWEKLMIAFKAEVDLMATQLASFRKELRTDKGFLWESWAQAAQWCVDNNTNLDQALLWADTATSINFGGDHVFRSWSVKAQVLDKLGKTNEADAAMKRGLPFAGVFELHQYGRQLLKQNKNKEALEVFKMNYDKNPNQFTALMGLTRGYAANGDNKNALKYANMALPLAPDAQNKTNVENLVQKLKEGKDINN